MINYYAQDDNIMESDIDKDHTPGDFSFDSGYCSTPNKLPGYSGLLDSTGKSILSIVKEEVVDSETCDPFISQAKVNQVSPLTSHRIAIENNVDSDLSDLKLEDWGSVTSCLEDNFEEKLFNFDGVASPISARKSRPGPHWHTPSSNQFACNLRLKKKRLFSPDGRLTGQKSPQKFRRLSPIKASESDIVSVQQNFTCSRSPQAAVILETKWKNTDTIGYARSRFSEVLRNAVKKTREEYLKNKENNIEYEFPGDSDSTNIQEEIASFPTLTVTGVPSRKKYTSLKSRSAKVMVVKKDVRAKSAKTLLLSQSSLQYVNIQPKPHTWRLT